MGVVAIFSYDGFIARYPEFAAAAPSPPAPAAAQFTASIAAAVMTVSAITAGSIAVGNFISGVGITPGTYVTSLGSGTGGAGTYNLNKSQSVSSEAMGAAAPFVSLALAKEYFAEATLYQRNDGGGPINDSDMQLRLLDMLTAHIAQLYSGSQLQPASPLVGRVQSATEGSVTVAADAFGQLPVAATWAAQTRYGLSWWQATAPFRTAVYLPGPRRVFDPALWGRRVFTFR